MVYEERNAWAGLIISPISMVVYVVLVLQQAAGRPLTDVDWFPLMLWVIGASIVAVIILSIVWGIIAGAKDPTASAGPTSATATSAAWADGSSRRSS